MAVWKLLCSFHPTASILQAPLKLWLTHCVTRPLQTTGDTCTRAEQNENSCLSASHVTATCIVVRTYCFSERGPQNDEILMEKCLVLCIRCLSFRLNDSNVTVTEYSTPVLCDNSFLSELFIKRNLMSSWIIYHTWHDIVVLTPSIHYIFQFHMRDDIQCLDFFLVLQQFSCLNKKRKKIVLKISIHYTPDFSGVISHNSHLLYNCDQSISKACNTALLWWVQVNMTYCTCTYVVWNQVKFLLHVDMYIVQQVLQTMHMLFENWVT